MQTPRSTNSRSSLDPLPQLVVNEFTPYLKDKWPLLDAIRKPAAEGSNEREQPPRQKKARRSQKTKSVHENTDGTSQRLGRAILTETARLIWSNPTGAIMNTETSNVRQMHIKLDADIGENTICALLRSKNSAFGDTLGVFPKCMRWELHQTDHNLWLGKLSWTCLSSLLLDNAGAIRDLRLRAMRVDSHSVTLFQQILGRMHILHRLKLVNVLFCGSVEPLWTLNTRWSRIKIVRDLDVHRRDPNLRGVPLPTPAQLAALGTKRLDLQIHAMVFPEGYDALYPPAARKDVDEDHEHTLSEMNIVLTDNRLHTGTMQRGSLMPSRTPKDRCPEPTPLTEPAPSQAYQGDHRRSIPERL